MPRKQTRKAKCGGNEHKIMVIIMKREEEKKNARERETERETEANLSLHNVLFTVGEKTTRILNFDKK